MNKHLLKAQIYLNGLQLRERALLLALGIIILYLVFTVAIFSPFEVKMKKNKSKMSTVNNSINNIQAQIDAILKEITEGSAAKVKKQREKLQEEIKQLDSQLSGLSTRLTTTTQTTELLKELFEENKNLKLIHFKTKTTAVSKEEAAASFGGQIFEHHLTLTFQGQYFAVISFLKEIQELQQRIIWDELDYDVTSYPKASITIRLHTLSAKKAWINV